METGYAARNTRFSFHINKNNSFCLWTQEASIHKRGPCCCKELVPAQPVIKTSNLTRSTCLEFNLEGGLFRSWRVFGVTRFNAPQSDIICVALIESRARSLKVGEGSGFHL